MLTQKLCKVSEHVPDCTGQKAWSFDHGLSLGMVSSVFSFFLFQQISIRFHLQLPLSATFHTLTFKVHLTSVTLWWPNFWDAELMAP